MKLNDKYKIVATDDRNVTIQEKVVTEVKDKDGEVIKINTSWKVIGYYRDVNQVLHGLIRKEINGTGLKSFKAVCEKIDELHEYIDEVCKKCI